MQPADLVAVQMTPPGMGAIGVILLSARNAEPLTSLLFHLTAKPTLPSVPIGGKTRGSIRDSMGTILDDALLVRTRETAWELHLHGGTAVMTSVLNLLKANHVHLFTPDQAAHAGLLGSLLEGEVQVALAQAATLSAARLLLSQPAVQNNWAHHWIQWLATAPPENLWIFHAAVQWVLARSATLAHLLASPRIAIIGPPNAGKSTLANALLGRPAAITSNIPGTTRDWVEGHAVFAFPQPSRTVEVAVTLVDTAGIRFTADPIERQSIQRTHTQANTAHAVIALFDATRPPTPEELQLAAPRKRQPVIVAVNKMDTATEIPPALKPFNPIPLSAHTGTGLDHLRAAVLHALDLAVTSDAECFAFTARQQELLTALSRTDDSQAAVALLMTFAPDNQQ